MYLLLYSEKANLKDFSFIYFMDSKVAVDNNKEAREIKGREADSRVVAPQTDFGVS